MNLSRGVRALSILSILVQLRSSIESMSAYCERQSRFRGEFARDAYFRKAYRSIARKGAR